MVKYALYVKKQVNIISIRNLMVMMNLNKKRKKLEEMKFKIMYDEAEENDMDDAFNDFMLNNIRRFNNFMDSLDIDN